MPVLKGIDYYGVLGLTKEAETNDIKSGYRRLAVQYSADWQKDVEISKVFSLAGEAYEILSDNNLRAIYDKYGEGGLKKGVLTPQGWHAPWMYHGDPVRTYREFFGTKNPYADLLEQMHAKKDIVLSPDGKGPKKKQDPVTKPLPLTLEEVYNGTLKKMKIVRKVFKEDNTTTELRERVLKIEIKKGILPGTEIIFEKIGDEGPISVPGDLKYVTQDLPHPVYKREGVNLRIVKSVNLVEALGGMTISIQTLDGRVFKTRITEVINPGYKKIIPNEGMPLVNDPDSYGDLIINFSIEFPMYIPDICKEIISKCLSESDEFNQTGENKKDQH